MACFKRELFDIQRSILSRISSFILRSNVTYGLSGHFVGSILVFALYVEPWFSILVCFPPLEKYKILLERYRNSHHSFLVCSNFLSPSNGSVLSEPELTCSRSCHDLFFPKKRCESLDNRLRKHFSNAKFILQKKHFVLYFRLNRRNRIPRPVHPLRNGANAKPICPSPTRPHTRFGRNRPFRFFRRKTNPFRSVEQTVVVARHRIVRLSGRPAAAKNAAALVYLGRGTFGVGICLSPSARCPHRLARRGRQRKKASD